VPVRVVTVSCASAARENEARRIARRDKNKIRLMENDMMSAPFAFPM
jgi:hypothetical protein